MTRPTSFFCCALIVVLLFRTPAPADQFSESLASADSVAAYHRALPRLQKMLEQKSMQLGAPLFIRIFKESSELELWMLGPSGRFELFKTYIICQFSGGLGPKLQTGDKQGPEGFYSVGPGQMNPWSNNHLAFNLGYPNHYDRALGRSGSALMVHGGCTSEGCYAMTDYYMDEIYTLADTALAHGQPAFQVHVYPFRMGEDRLNEQRDSPWFSFWKNLKQGYDLFETHRLPPRVEVSDNRYLFSHDYDRSIARIDF